MLSFVSRDLTTVGGSLLLCYAFSIMMHACCASNMERAKES